MKRWSRKHDQCVKCGNQSTRHCGRGLCKNCWNNEFNAAHPEHVRGIKHASYLRRGGKANAKVKRESFHFDNMREPVLMRDGYKCMKCGKTKLLVVHHKDENGRGSPNPNNSMDNLITYCRGCHITEHRPKLKAALGFICVDQEKWSSKYDLDACLRCGRSDRKHNSHGMCDLCAAIVNHEERKSRKLSV